MGLLEKIFGNKPAEPVANLVGQTFKTFTAYQPAFHNFAGSVYESELVRAAADAKARHISKLKVEFKGAAKPALRTIMRHQPNEFQTWSQFLYRTSTILDMQNTCFIVGITDKYGEIKGYFPVLPSSCEIREWNGTLYLRYKFASGEMAAVELAKCAVLTKFQYEDDFFGSSNVALQPTMNLIALQNQGIQEAIKQGGSFRFMARLNNFRSPEDMKKEQENFTNTSLASETGGFLLFPNTYSDIQQIKSNPVIVDADQMKLIQTNVFNYFGVNEKVLQNVAIGDELDAFYEGVIEPFAIQLSEALTKQTFTLTEQSYGSEVFVTANRLQYMKTSDKINYVKELADRGLIKINEARELLNYPPLDDEQGEKLPIRGEFKYVGEEEAPKEEPQEQVITEDPAEDGGDKDGV